MAEKDKLFIQANEAVGWGAVAAGCKYFFGYPITPQNEIPEWFAREFPKHGGFFLQSQSETGSINMLYGAAAMGVRVMTSTSGPGWSLMQETMSHLCNAELPCVILLVQRGGPGGSPTRHAQMDYISAVWGGAHGGSKNIVLAPSSTQEVYDFVQTAFYLADKYRNPVVVLSDAIVGQTAEVLRLRTLKFPPLPEKDWAMGGKAHRKDGERRIIQYSHGSHVFEPPYDSHMSFWIHLDKKFRQMQSEVRYEERHTEDAELIVVAYGYTSRVSKEAVDMARAEGIKVGMIRPISLFPFPSQVIREKAEKGARFLVVEDCLGQMINDVKLAVEGKSRIDFLGIFGRHLTNDSGMILPDRVLQEIRKLVRGDK